MSDPVPLPTPTVRSPDVDVPQAIEHRHNWGQCLTQYCPKLNFTDKFQRCLSCGQCRFC